MELTQQGKESDNSRDILFLMGGAALVVFGAGLIMSTPIMRRLLGEVSIGGLVSTVVPNDLQRYLKIRAM